MKYALIDPDDKVINIISYKEGSNYTPQISLRLEKIPDEANIGDKISKGKVIKGPEDKQLPEEKLVRFILGDDEVKNYLKSLVKDIQ